MFSSPAPLTPALSRLFRIQLGAGAAAALASLMLMTFGAASAPAALIATNICNENALSTPFSRWSDKSSYELMSGGTFETNPAGWTLAGGAARVSGNEPFDVSGTGSYSLSLPHGASAQTPYTCVNAAYPTFRFFARNSGALSTVLVQVVYKLPIGTVALPLGVVALSSTWSPTAPMLTGSVVAGVLSGGTAQASLKFTALTGSSQIDDVYIDPRMR
jgi:hypothetical protein